jgi:hypothetical protein
MGTARLSWRPSSRPVRVERIVDRPTIRSSPSTGKPATMAWGWVMEPLTIVNFVLSLAALGASIMANRANSKVGNDEGS